MSYWTKSPYHVESLRRGKYRAHILVEADAEDPRPEERIGTVVALHASYRSSDVPLSDMEEVREYWDDVRRSIARGIRRRTGRPALGPEIDEALVALPVWGYDHSGLAVSLTPFSCPWDSGRLGTIYARLDRHRPRGRLQASRQEVVDRLRYEFSLWKSYIENDIYEYCVVDSEDQLVDGCTGYAGEAALEICRHDARRALAEIAGRRRSASRGR